jgi:G3E family GTPase
MENIPVHILTGFLGAGKTTAIISLLKQKPPNENWAIVINEFGKISIDGQTLTEKSGAGSVYEITGGCICCSAKVYFAENLEKIVRQKQFDRIIIEPSGLGGIDHITELVRQNAELQLMPVVCIVDVSMTKLPRLKMVPIYRSQIQNADLILFSKSDLVEEAELKKLTDQFSLDFPGKKYVGQSSIDNIFIQSFNKQLPDQDLHFSNLHTIKSDKKNNYQEILITGIKTINPDILTPLLKKEPSIVRAKGYIYTGNEWLFINYTLTGISLECCGQRSESELVIIFDSTYIFDSQLFISQIEKD